MAAKMLTPEQCQWMHQRFPPPDCCLCNARVELACVQGELSDALSALVQERKEIDALRAQLDAGLRALGGREP